MLIVARIRLKINAPHSRLERENLRLPAREANAIVAPAQLKAMPVILTMPAEANRTPLPRWIDGHGEGTGPSRGGSWMLISSSTGTFSSALERSPVSILKR
jgi:hypothetical protein